MMRYSAEIDGLRAIAVLAVMLFHARLPMFSGGFIGVDVFFVISGYLITQIIQQQLATKQFSLVNFYERRARRILPALFFVCITSSIFAWLWLLPRDFVDYFKSLNYLSFFASNVFFFSQSGYFDTAAELKPLLHTWSLSVEEQFYVVFPLLMILFWRLGKFKLQIILFSILAISFFYADTISVPSPSENFFLIFSRCWELSVGALLATFLTNATQHNNINFIVAEILSSIGLLSIVLAIFYFDHHTPFPSKFALLPTLGAALIIAYASPKTFVGKILGWKPVVLIGLISYSAYLWHQPVLAFMRHRFLNVGQTYMLLGLVLSLLLAYISWRYIEQPFRDKNRFSRPSIFGLSILGLLLMFAGGDWLQKYAKSEHRLSAQAIDIYNAKQDRAGSPDDCYVQTIFQDNTCVLGNKDKVVGALIGDSHALAISHNLANQLNENDQGFKFFTFSGCPPVLNIYRVDKKDYCDQFNQQYFKYLINAKHIKTVVIAARWALNLTSKRFNNLEGGVELKGPKIMDVSLNGIKQSSSPKGREARIAAAYQNSINLLLASGKHIILIYPIPELGWDLPNRAAKLALYHGGDISDPLRLIQQTSTSHALFTKRNKAVYDAFNALGAHQNLSRIFPEHIFCSTIISERCVGMTGGDIYYFDDNHLTNTGAQLINDQVVNLIRKSQDIKHDD